MMLDLFHLQEPFKMVSDFIIIWLPKVKISHKVNFYCKAVIVAIFYKILKTSHKNLENVQRLSQKEPSVMAELSLNL
jgi:hypothetical protein